jgi:hypothetical protein
MCRNSVHEPQTRVSQAKFLLVLLVLKFEKAVNCKDFRQFHLHHTNQGKVRVQTLLALTFSTLESAQAMQY